MSNQVQIAIDGPVAAGKGTVAFRLAQKLKILYVDTGAMYRAVALLGLRQGLNLEKAKPLLALLPQAKIELQVPQKDDGRFCTVLLNGEDITWKIREPRISKGASQVAIFPKVRKYLVNLQKQIAKSQSVVMEGRDITTVVLPNADLKVYLTADQKERARRRFLQQKALGEDQPFAEVLEETKQRDHRDKTKGALKLAEDAWVLDTTNLTINQVVEKILNQVKKAQK